ncbi:glycosyltransferase family 2 protein [Metabacillus sp. GX 13764]|uniref:glycosyltransferase family 2 protein n=1 Tax=Metabacillus kandeliae TaxID=2900151 RepID=UPI001E5F4A39|nr:glycosyltransferase family A protein [Metabacillus kandeliae]MCD7035227.1 glycosyltransferase family 2 protein [Metabacillus kandeliae]
MTIGKYIQMAIFDGGAAEFVYEGFVLPEKAIHLVESGSLGKADFTGQNFLIGPQLGAEKSEAGICLSIGTNGLVAFEYSYRQLTSILCCPAEIKEKPVHFACVYRNRKPELYLNGSKTAEGIESRKRTVFPSGLGGGSQYGKFAGSWESLKVWGRILAEEEIIAASNRQDLHDEALLAEWGVPAKQAMDIQPVNIQLPAVIPKPKENTLDKKRKAREERKQNFLLKRSRLWQKNGASFTAVRHEAPGKRLKVSFIIPFQSSSTELKELLSSLVQQTLRRDQYEIILVDGSGEESVSQWQKYLENYRIKTISMGEKSGRGAAMNRGAEAAKGDILIFLDSRIKAGKRLAESRLLVHYKSDDALVSGGWGIPATENLSYFEKHLDRFKLPFLAVQSGNFSISRRTFREAGPFDESFESYEADDLEYPFRLYQRGVRFVINRTESEWLRTPDSEKREKDSMKQQRLLASQHQELPTAILSLLNKGYPPSFLHHLLVEAEEIERLYPGEYAEMLPFLLQPEPGSSQWSQWLKSKGFFYLKQYLEGEKDSDGSGEE